MLWWTYAAHAALFCVWCFLVVFGSVMEARQRMSLVFVSCDDNDSTTACPSDAHLFGVNDECCISPDDGRQTYQNAYNILNIVGGTLASAHIGYFANIGARALFQRIGDVLFLFHKMVDGTLHAVVFIGLAYVYQHLNYFVFFCHHNPITCEHPPRDHWVVQRLFYSLLALGSPYLFTQLCRTIALAFLFAFYRHGVLTTVMSTERLLEVFSDEIEGTFSRRIVRRYRNVRSFVRAWLDKNDDDVSADLERKAARIMQALRRRPEDDTEVIDFSRFRERVLQMMHQDGSNRPFGDRAADVCLRCLEEGEVVGADHQEGDEKGDGGTEGDRVRRIWIKMTEHDRNREEEKNGRVDDDTEVRLTEKGVQDMLYDLFFLRKELIHSMHTDHYILTYLASVALFLLYPASFIAIARIFGYHNAFGTGVDLFKTYILGASYMITSVKDDVMFLLSMLTDRPFDIGDILLLNGQTYKVRRFSLTHLYMDGPYYVSVPNKRFSTDTTINLSKQGITDSLQIAFPLSVSDKDVNRDTLYAILHSYQARNDRDVSRSSIRCGWALAPDGNTKVMQCNWRYKFRIYDRSRLNWARADIRDHIISSLDAHLERGFMKYHVAGGGGLNDLFRVER